MEMSGQLHTSHSGNLTPIKGHQSPLDSQFHEPEKVRISCPCCTLNPVLLSSSMYPTHYTNHVPKLYYKEHNMGAHFVCHLNFILCDIEGGKEAEGV